MIVDKRWTSIPDMTRDVDLVVVGTVVATRPLFDGRYLGPAMVTDVAVSSVLKGEPADDAPGRVQVETYGSVPGSSVLPAQQHLLFLSRDDSQRGYYLPGLFQNVFANVDGRVVIPLAHEIKRAADGNIFPLELQGTSFDGLVSQVRDAVARQSLSPQPIGILAAQRPVFAC
jgi:hypothetical protein